MIEVIDAVPGELVGGRINYAAALEHAEWLVRELSARSSRATSAAARAVQKATQARDLFQATPDDQKPAALEELSALVQRAHRLVLIADSRAKESSQAIEFASFCRQALQPFLSQLN